MSDRATRSCRSWLSISISLSLAFLIPLSPAQSQPGAGSLASEAIPGDRVQQYSNLAVEWMRKYLRIDTTNPPGSELKAATFMKRICDQEGIGNQIFEYAPGRADLWAGPHSVANSERPIILLNHMDVVTSDPSHWRVAPFSGEIVDGSIYGRGAQDMKDEGLAQLVALVMIKRERVRLKRDLLFLGVSDEEVNGSGTGWFVSHHRDLLGNAEFLINEGGENLVENGKVKFVGVEVGEKSTFWLLVVAHGRAGHGSRPIADSAPDRLIEALGRIVRYRTPLKVLPVAEEFLREMVPYEPPERAHQFRNVQQAVHDKRFQEEVERDESLNYMLRNSITLTMLGGSEQTNVIPPEAWANLDVRLLPGEDPRNFLESIRQAVVNPNVTVMPLNSEFRPANSSPTSSALYQAIREVSAQLFSRSAGAPAPE